MDERLQVDGFRKEVREPRIRKAIISELNELVQSFKADAAKITNADELWTLVDSMRNKRHEFEGKYEYRYSILITVFARLVAEQRISSDDLDKPDEDKLAAITAGAEFFRS
ncbi:MAG: hypothetical protein ABI564_01810 [Ideonella sp.]